MEGALSSGCAAAMEGWVPDLPGYLGGIHVKDNDDGTLLKE